MMRGYDRDEAYLYMISKIDRDTHRELGDLVDSILSQCIEADMAYMHESGVLDEEGNAGDAWYEEDDAFEYIVDYIAEKNHFNPDQAVAAAMVVNDFMELQAQYMEKKGLVSYEGE